MKRVTVFVGGIRSVLQSHESEEYMRHVASRADLMLRTVKHDNPALATDKAAVLALINAVDRIEKTDHRKDQKREISLQERLKIERLEAALSSAKEVIHETQARLEEYQARDQLLEAGLIPLGSPMLSLDNDADSEYDEIEVSPDQLSFSQYLGGGTDHSPDHEDLHHE